MKTFKEYIKEHPNLRTRIVKAINPMDKLRDTMADLRKLPGKAKDKAIKSLQKKNGCGKSSESNKQKSNYDEKRQDK